MKILVIGKNGQVAWQLQRALMPLGNVLAVDKTTLDLADNASIISALNGIQPDVIINAGAYTAVDKAEQEQQLALQINGTAPTVLAEQAQKLNALLVHYSTDYVFDGRKASPYLETDPTNPGNYYGASKLAGEQGIQATLADYLILRTSWVYDKRGHNFLLTMLRLMQDRAELNVVNDQIGTPTWAKLIAESTAHIVKQAMLERQQNRFVSDLYHLTSQGETSWHGFANQIMNLAQSQSSRNLAIKSINPIPSKDYPTPALRPLNSRLSIAALSERFGLELPAWDAALKLCMEELV